MRATGRALPNRWDGEKAAGYVAGSKGVVAAAAAGLPSGLLRGFEAAAKAAEENCRRKLAAEASSSGGRSGTAAGEERT